MNEPIDFTVMCFIIYLFIFVSDVFLVEKRLQSSTLKEISIKKLDIVCTRVLRIVKNRHFSILFKINGVKKIQNFNFIIKIIV